jgi:hypothetical protein
MSEAPSPTCEICSALPDEEYAFSKYGWPAEDTSLPGAASRLEVARDLDPHGGRRKEVRRCPACGRYYLYRTDYTFLAGGSEDEEFLTRLTDAEAQALLAASD